MANRKYYVEYCPYGVNLSYNSLKGILLFGVIKFLEHRKGHFCYENSKTLQTRFFTRDCKRKTTVSFKLC